MTTRDGLFIRNVLTLAVALAPEVQAYGDALAIILKCYVHCITPEGRPRPYATGLEDTAGILPHS